MVCKSQGGFRWAGVEVQPYKADGNIFKDVTRQLLFEGKHDLPVELRYFEVGPGGHSTLERHQHAHAVVIIRGNGQVLVGDEVMEIGPHDFVQIPPMTWHQFRADPDEALGFLCLVAKDRDRPMRPDNDALDALRQNDVVAQFIRV